MILYPNTLFIGKVCVHLDTVSSTQTYLKKLYAKSKPIEGTAILSYDQTEGKGQRNNAWKSEKGSNIALSLILLPIFLNPDKQFYLSMAMALAVKKTVELSTKQKVKLKWPNDIMAGDRKISGILLESSLQNSIIEKTIVGIGLNVNQVNFASLNNRATSMSNVSGQNFVLDEVTVVLLEWIEKYYLQIKANRLSQLLIEYNNALYKLNDPVMLRMQDGNLFSATLKGVNEAGKLLVVNNDGQEVAYLHGEVQIEYAGVI